MSKLEEGDIVTEEYENGKEIKKQVINVKEKDSVRHIRMKKVKQ